MANRIIMTAAQPDPMIEDSIDCRVDDDATRDPGAPAVTDAPG